MAGNTRRLWCVPWRVWTLFECRGKIAVVTVVCMCLAAYSICHYVISSYTVNDIVVQLTRMKDRIPFGSHKYSTVADNTGPTSYPTDVQRLELEIEYERRRVAIEAACKKAGRPVPDVLSSSDIPSNFLVEPTHSIIYCPITKIGSTFWLRTLSVMTRDGNVSSPFSIRRTRHGLIGYETFRRQQSKNGMKIFLKNATSFLFSRDPYSRLFSAYENKLFCVNWMYWKSLGRKIIKTVRNNTSETFGNDVTFAELIKYILMLYERKQKIDKHFKPMHDMCDPCSIPFDFVGKMKTFKADALYLLKKWQSKKETHVHFGDFEKETSLDTASGHLRFTFQAYNKLLETTNVPLYDLLLRAWRDMQIRGKIPITLDMPLTTDEAENATHESVMELIKKALDEPANRTQLTLQREEAMVQAYQTVPLDDMERLRNFVKMDCDLFGFDDRPSKLFDRNKAVPPVEHPFNYFT